MYVGSLAGVIYLRYTMLMSSNKSETSVHCCDPALLVLVMLVSRNVFHVISTLQSIVLKLCFYLKVISCLLLASSQIWKYCPCCCCCQFLFYFAEQLETIPHIGIDTGGGGYAKSLVSHI